MDQFILPALLVIVYAAFIVPQIRKRRATSSLLASLTEGDEVVTSSGLHGIISALDESVVYVEVSEGVELKFSRSSIATKVESDVHEDS